MSDVKKKDDRHTVRTTRLQTTQLHELRVKKGLSNMSDILRYCVDYTLEDESDAIGSRRNFSRTMNQRLDQIREDQHIGFSMVILVITEMLTRLVNLLQEEDEGEIDEISPQEMRVALYKKSITNELVQIVNAVNAVQKQQRAAIRKTKK